MAERETGFKEKVKRYGMIAGIGGGVLFLVAPSGLAFMLGLGGGAAYGGAKYLENKGQKR